MNYFTFILYPIPFGSVGRMETVDTETVAYAVLARVVAPVGHMPTVMYNCSGVYRLSGGTSLVALSDPVRSSVGWVVAFELAASFALLFADMVLYCQAQAVLLLQALHLAEAEQLLCCCMG